MLTIYKATKLNSDLNDGPHVIDDNSLKYSHQMSMSKMEYPEYLEHMTEKYGLEEWRDCTIEDLVKIGDLYMAIKLYKHERHCTFIEAWETIKQIKESLSLVDATLEDSSM